MVTYSINIKNRDELIYKKEGLSDNPIADIYSDLTNKMNSSAPFLSSLINTIYDEAYTVLKKNILDLQHRCRSLYGSRGFEACIQEWAKLPEPAVFEIILTDYKVSIKLYECTSIRNELYSDILTQL